MVNGYCNVYNKKSSKKELILICERLSSQNIFLFNLLGKIFVKFPEVLKKFNIKWIGKPKEEKQNETNRKS